jgi:hypothetical protein
MKMSGLYKKDCCCEKKERQGLFFEKDTTFYLYDILLNNSRRMRGTGGKASWFIKSSVLIGR